MLLPNQASKITDIEPVSFTATVPLEPSVDLRDYRTIRVESESTEVSAEDVDGVIERIQQEQAVWEPVDRRCSMATVSTLT